MTQSHTFCATVAVTPIRYLGSADDCRAWCSVMLGREVLITDVNGEQHVVGIITQTKSENADGI